MKIYFLTAVACLLFAHSGQAIHLTQAIASHTIQISLTGLIPQNGSSSHTGKCLQLQVENLSAQKITIESLPGWSVTNLRNEAQNLLVLDPLNVVLPPHGKSSLALNAVCTEKNNAAPKPEDSFRLDLAGPRHELQVLAQLLYKEKCYTHTAQQAVWVLTDHNLLEDVYDTHADTLLENKLVAFLATTLNKAKPQRIQRPPSVPRILRYPLEAEGKFEVEITRAVTIGYHLTDSNLNVIETIIPDQFEGRRGTARFSYMLRLQRPKGKYFICQRRDQQMVKVQEIVLGG